MTLKACMFTNAPDNHFLIDLHPELPQVSYASACSGHGFKFASVIGEVLADLAMHRQTRHQIDLFSHERFRSSAPLGTGDTAVRRHARRAPGEVTAARPLHARPAAAVGGIDRDDRVGTHPYRRRLEPLPYATTGSEQERLHQERTIWSPWG
jgi:sarcosine oxidase